MIVQVVRVETHLELTDGTENVILVLRLPNTGKQISCYALQPTALADIQEALRGVPAERPTAPLAPSAAATHVVTHEPALVEWATDTSLPAEVRELLRVYGVPARLTPEELGEWLQRISAPEAPPVEVEEHVANAWSHGLYDAEDGAPQL